MFATLFGKSTVWNYLFSITLLLGLVIYFHIKIYDGYGVSFQQFESLSAFFILLILMISMDWVSKKNYWVSKNCYPFFVFLFLFSLTPLQNWNLVQLIFLFFLWFSFSILISIKTSPKDEGVIVFNSFFWLITGSLLYPKGIIFIFLYWLLLILFSKATYRNLFISLLALFNLYVLIYTLEQLFPEINVLNDYTFSNLFSQKEYSFTNRHELTWLVTISLFLFLGVFNHLLEYRTKNTNYSLLKGSVGFFLLSIIILNFSYLNIMNGFQILIIILIASTTGEFFNKIKNKWVKEILFLGCLAFSIYRLLFV